MRKRQDLKVVLMSATLNAEMFSNYFSEFGCCLVNIPGRAYPVTTFFLEDALEHTGFKILPQSDYVYKTDSKQIGAAIDADPNKRRQMAADRAARQAALNRQLNGKCSPETMKSLEIVDERSDTHTYTHTYLRTHMHAIHTYSIHTYRTTRTRQHTHNCTLIHIHYTRFFSNTHSILNIELIQALVVHISTQCEPGAILIFVPGLSDIRDVIEALKEARQLDPSAVKILPLHSSLSSSEQSRVFDVPNGAIRKIVVSTNIAGVLCYF